MPDNDKLVDRLLGRAAFCRDRGEIKTPELLEAAAHAIQSERMEGEIAELRASLIELLEPLERASAELVAQGKAADENAEAAFDRARAALNRSAGHD